MNKNFSMPPAIYALMLGAFGIGTTEFVIMGLLPEVAQQFHVSIASAGFLITGYALGVAVGAPFLSLLSLRFSQKTALISLMAIFTIGNLVCAIAPTYWVLMIARVITSFAHGTYFGIGALVATSLVRKDQQALAIALMLTGLTFANMIGVPLGTLLGQHFGWRSTFWAVAVFGPLTMMALAVWLPQDKNKLAIDVKQELSIVRQPQVLLSLMLTVLGFSGVFAVFTYIAPLLTSVTKFHSNAIAPILLVFGLGLIVGNIVGGKLADKKLITTLIGSLVLLAVVLAALGIFIHDPITMIVLIGLFGFAGFATVPALQMNVLAKTNSASALVSALNIGAFNIGNAFGAWAGGLVIMHGMGLQALPWLATLIVISGIGLAIFSNWQKIIKYRGFSAAT
jgi:DHA1 family inner membrane transport protein